MMEAMIDTEVRTIIEGQHARARSILETRRDALEAVAEKLLERETLERSDLEALVS